MKITNYPQLLQQIFAGERDLQLDTSDVDQPKIAARAMALFENGSILFMPEKMIQPGNPFAVYVLVDVDGNLSYQKRTKR